jgi:hypothetical protein
MPAPFLNSLPSFPMDEAEQLHDFLRDLNQEIQQRAATDGLLFEEAATRHLTDLLADVDLTADVVYCTESRQAGNVVYRINAFALGEEDENLDLFVVLASNENGEVSTLDTKELDRLARLPEQFLTRGLKGMLKTEIDKHSPAYELATKLAGADTQPVRVRVFVLTTALLGSRVQGIEERSTKHGNVLMQFHVWDLDRFYRTSTGGYAREPIAIDFVRDFGGPLPCLPMPVQNEDYKSYLAILPGDVLADVYEKYGARLLEQNVRSFLQFGNKTNKGIRETIMKEPHRFLAYNNGLTATANEVELTVLPEGGHGLSSIRSLQIVNGGQTTASIFQTRRKDNASLSQVFVQMKLTVMKHEEEMAVMVPLISRFANTQNGVSPADLSANSEFNVALERVSRTTTAPAPAGTQVLTRWFYERARGQYKVELARRLTKASRTAFERENPKNQVLTKESVAKFELAWSGEPHIVARGAQKLYAFFINPPDEVKGKGKPKPRPKPPVPDKYWFQDLVAKAVLFQAAEKLYDKTFGRGGGYRALTVCYSVAWLRQLMNPQPFSLTRIWRQQQLTEAMDKAMVACLIVVDEYLRDTAGNRTAREWAVRDECWEQLKKLPVPTALASAIKAVPTADRSADTPRAAQSPDVLAREEAREQAMAITSLGASAWDAIENWGDNEHHLSASQIELSGTIAIAIRSRSPLSEAEIKGGNEIIDLLVKHKPDLLADVDEPTSTVSASADPSGGVTLDDVDALLEWDEKQKTKRIWPKANEQLMAFQTGKDELTPYWQMRVGLWIERFKEYGFEPLNQHVS